MKPAPFTFHRPRTRDELFSLLDSLDNARVLAGGQSLMPMLNLRIAAPDHLIDLNSVAGLDGMEVSDGMLKIGAMTRQRVAERSVLVAKHLPILCETLGHVGYQQTRNRGTVGGSIAHMDPTAELPVIALATDATLTIASARGERNIPFSKLSTGYLTTQIEPDEALVRIEFPIWREPHGSAFAEVTRRGESFAIVSAAALVALDPTGNIVRIAIAVGGLGGAPLRVTGAETALLGRKPDDDAVRAGAAVAATLAADGDMYAPEDYKRHLAVVLTERTLRRAIARAGRQPAKEEQHA